MGVFSPYEILVLQKLLEARYDREQIETIVKDAMFVSLEHTGVGYFLTVTHPLMPAARIVCSAPTLTGRFQHVLCGFVLFLEGGELTFECFSYPSSANADGFVPEDIRDQPVEIERAG
jgi:hypothetical protein